MKMASVVLFLGMKPNCMLSIDMQITSHICIFFSFSCNFYLGCARKILKWLLNIGKSRSILKQTKVYIVKFENVYLISSKSLSSVSDGGGGDPFTIPIPTHQLLLPISPITSQCSYMDANTKQLIVSSFPHICIYFVT